MGKRFGRNQKRRMRQQIEQLQRERAAQDEQIALQIDALKRYKSAMNRIEDVIDKSHVLNDASSIEAPRPKPRTWRVPRDRRTSLDLSYPMSEERPLELAELAAEELPTLLAEIEEQGIGTHHVRIFHGGHQVAYAVDPAMLARMSRPMMIELISQEVGYLLADAYKAKYGTEKEANQ